MPLTKIRLSHSSLDTLQDCERKFELDRLLVGGGGKRESIYFSRGHAFGKGVQVYILTGNMDLALYHAWLDYWPAIEKPPQVTLHRTLHALLCAQSKLDELRAKYEVVQFRGKPSIELGFRLNIDETYYYVGFIDLVLRNKQTGKYIILECKYTGYKRDDVSVLYKNSGQAVGYSIALDEIVGEAQSEYGVLYFICQDKDVKPKEFIFHALEYDKTLRDRFRWFITLGMDVEHIKQMRKLKVFPMRGQNCNKYGNACYHFGLCHMQSGDQERNDEPDPHEEKGSYTFTYDLNKLIASHLEREGA